MTQNSSVYCTSDHCVVVWTNDMFRMQSHDINQPITVICKICDVVVVVVVVVVGGVVVVVVGTVSV